MRVFAAPFCRVTFADFWLADQLNSLSILFSDFVYYICFYVNFYSADEVGLEEGGVDGGGAGGNLCMFDSKTYLIVRALFTALPAWFRFAQCLRRYADEAKPRSLFPHVVNAGKYSTTFFVVAFSTMTELTIGKWKGGVFCLVYVDFIERLEFFKHSLYLLFLFFSLFLGVFCLA